MRKKGYLIPILLLSLTVILGGCSGPGVGIAHKSTFVFAQGAEPRGLDPAYVDDGESAKIIANIYDTLVRYKSDSTDIKPGLATSWESNEDGTVWTFYLRKGIKFHDGTPFTADAVKFSYERQMPPNKTENMPYSSFTFGKVKEIRVVDDYTVEIQLKEPYTPFLASLAMHVAAPIVSPSSARKYGDRFTEQPVGTGPFKFVKWVRGQHILLESNNEYWDVIPGISSLVFKFDGDNSVRTSELLAGEVDFIDNIDPSGIKTIENIGLDVIKEPGMNINYFAFICDRPPFNSAKVRQAISMAINRKNIVDYLYQGQADLANGPLPPFLPGYSNSLQPYHYDPEKAKQLLAAAGYSEGELKFTILAYSNPRPYNPSGGSKLAAAIQADLRKIGVYTDIKVYPWKEYRNAVFKPEGNAFVYGWIGDNGDPDNFLTLFDSKEIETSLNKAKYSNPAVDSLLQEARTTSDTGKRRDIYRLAQQIILEDAPWVFISHSDMIGAHRSGVQNLSFHPTGVIYFKDVIKK